MVTKASSTTYTYTAEDIKRILVEHLQLDPTKTSVRFDVQNTADDRFGGTSYDLVAVHVKVEEKQRT